MVLMMSSMHISTELLHLSTSSTTSTSSLDHVTLITSTKRTEQRMFKRQQSGSGNADGENFSQQEEEENVDGGEMHKKKKKKKQEVESLHDIHSTVKFGVREADGKHVSFRNPTIEKYFRRLLMESMLVLGWGLADNKKPFLWIIRPDLVIGGSVILSSEFVNETKDRSLIGNQPTNYRYICNEWEIGIEIDTNVKREEVEKLVNDLMAGEKGKKMRQKIMELKMKADEGKFKADKNNSGKLDLKEFKEVVGDIIERYPQVGIYLKKNQMKDMASLLKKSQESNIIVEIEYFKEALSKVDSQMKNLPITAQVASQQGVYLANYFNRMEECEKYLEGPLRFRGVGHHRFRPFRLLGDNSMQEFNEWIEDMELLEVPVVGKQYTWFRPNGESKSRLDRALISLEWRDTWAESVQFTLSRNFSDHCPILLKANNVDWGPKPFRILNCWLTDKSFKEVVNQCWNFVQVSGWGPYGLKEKIKRLKCRLKIWNKEEYGDSFKKVQQLEVELNKLEEDTLHRQMTDLEISRRKKLQEDLRLAAQTHEALLRQKSRSRWLKEGDCNTTFFHIWVNANRNRNCIKGLLIEGVWTDEPNKVTKEIRTFFSNRFQEADFQRPKIDGIIFK
ncbi:External alternative NAD(P)H-ubiquinone oxidoreductase B4, mitochondrial [Glycine soja]|uniref:External alternative NAD(P)H-ubiquinone oxidoreductase B4, mitochondrial n=1 Tax=Glycine soja TaxID=3848 RepID=A0A445I3Z0_GLYSO|nr:External alternative NAD(P)H-ubiquinone oxidoreductase B4, mitochondrial [Glycine soja]